MIIGCKGLKMNAAWIKVLSRELTLYFLSKWSGRENICSGLTEVLKKTLWYCSQRVSHGFFILFKTSLRYVYQTRKWNSHSCWHERIQAESKMKGRQKCPLNYAAWANGYSWFLIALQWSSLCSINLSKKYDYPTA